MPHEYSFRKSERLCNKRDFELLLSSSRSTSSPPLKVVWKELGSAFDDNAAVKVAVSVPKRYFKRAVDRNLLKRRIRDSYRREKHNLTGTVQQRGMSLRLLVVYTRKEILDQRCIDENVIHSLQNIENEIARRYPLSGNTALAGENTAPGAH